MRGSIFDIMSFFGVVLVLAVVGLVSVYVLSQMNAGLVDTGLIDGTAGEILTENTSRAPGAFDATVITVLIFSWIYMMVSGYLLATNPAFMVVGLFFGLIILAFIGPISNVFLDVAGMSSLSEAADLMPISNFVFSNAVTIVLGMLVTIIIATYAGFRQSQGAAYL